MNSFNWNWNQTEQLETEIDSDKSGALSDKTNVKRVGHVRLNNIHIDKVNYATLGQKPLDKLGSALRGFNTNEVKCRFLLSKRFEGALAYFLALTAQVMRAKMGGLLLP